MAAEAFDVAIVNGKVVSPFGTVTANIGITGGSIAGVLSPSQPISAERVLDAAGKHVLPGVIDPHVHFTSGKREFADSCREETVSMACGGVTCCLDFCQCVGSYHEVLGRYIEEIGANSLIDVAFHAIVMTKQHVEEVTEYVQRYGVTSFKMYMAAKGAELYPGTIAIDDGALYETFGIVAGLGPPAMAMVHAENWEIAWWMSEKLRRLGRNDAAAWTEGRPNICEEDGIRRAALLAMKQGSPLYIVHISTGEAPDLIREYRGKGLNIVGETCPHFLMISKRDEQAMLAKYNPAIKDEEDREKLWHGIRNGYISCVGSDHIALKHDEKFIGEGDIWSAMGGVPGSGTILPVMLSEGVNRGRISIEKVAEVCSFNPARSLGLYPQKGTISVGSDADIVIVDLDKEVTVTPQVLREDFALFDGWKFKGWPTLTMVRGTVVMENGEIVAKAGTGKYIPRRLETQAKDW